MKNNNMAAAFYSILIAVITGIAYMIGTDTIQAESIPLTAGMVLLLAGIIFLDVRRNSRERLAF